jgi:hypothetical protein
MENISFFEVKEWLGGDISINQLVALLVDIANQEYNAEQLKFDIQDYSKQSRG